MGSWVRLVGVSVAACGLGLIGPVAGAAGAMRPATAPMPSGLTRTAAAGSAVAANLGEQDCGVRLGGLTPDGGYTASELVVIGPSGARNDYLHPGVFAPAGVKAVSNVLGRRTGPSGAAQVQREMWLIATSGRLYRAVLTARQDGTGTGTPVAATVRLVSRGWANARFPVLVRSGAGIPMRGDQQVWLVRDGLLERYRVDATSGGGARLALAGKAAGFRGVRYAGASPLGLFVISVTGRLLHWSAVSYPVGSPKAAPAWQPLGEGWGRFDGLAWAECFAMKGRHGPVVAVDSRAGQSFVTALRFTGDKPETVSLPTPLLPWRWKWPVAERLS